MASQLRVDKILPVDGAPTGGGGGIIQIVSTTKTTAFTSSSTSYVDITGLSATITPKFNTSKIYMRLDLNSSADTRYAAFQFVRDSTAIAVGTDADSTREAVTMTAGSNNVITYDNLILRNQSMAILDSPATTSATTYKVQGKVTYSTGNFYINRCVYDDNETYVMRAASTITLMEISA